MCDRDHFLTVIGMTTVAARPSSFDNFTLRQGVTSGRKRGETDGRSGAGRGGRSRGETGGRSRGETDRGSRAGTGGRSRGETHRRKRTVLARRLVATFLLAMVAAFILSTMTDTPTGGALQRHTPAVEQPGPPSSEQILSGLNRDRVGPQP
jgi:hypothetical protein